MYLTHEPVAFDIGDIKPDTILHWILSAYYENKAWIMLQTQLNKIEKAL